MAAAILSETDSEWVTAVSARLAEVQASAADEPAERREEFLQEELQRGLKDVPGSRKKQRLQALLERFPVAGRVIAVPVPGQASPVGIAPVEVPDLNPEELAEKLAGLAASLPENRRTAIIERLAASGLVPGVDHGQLTLEIGDRLSRELHLRPGTQPRLTHAVELLARMLAMVQRVDVPVGKALLEIAPRSQLAHRPGEFARLASAYLAGEGNLPEAQLQSIERCLGAVAAAALQGGREFGKEIGNLLSPDNIRQVCEKEGTKILGPSIKEKCWDRFRKLFTEEYGSAELVDRRFRECVAPLLERMTKGLGPNAGG